MVFFLIGIVVLVFIFWLGKKELDRNEAMISEHHELLLNVKVSSPLSTVTDEVQLNIIEEVWYDKEKDELFVATPIVGMYTVPERDETRYVYVGIL